MSLFLKQEKTNSLFLLLISLLQLIAAVVLGSVLLPIGVLYSIGRAFIQFKGKDIFKVIANLIDETFRVSSWLFNRAAVGIDLLGNVLAGELFEDATTHKEDTLFGKSGVTVSAALGELKIKGKLNKFGTLLGDLLDFIDKNHIRKSYYLYLKKKV